MSLIAACQRKQEHAAEPAWPALNGAFLASAAATSNFRLGRPVPLAIARNGRVLFRRTPPRDRRADLHVLEPNGETHKLLDVEQLLAGAAEQLSADEQARRERTRTITSGIVDIELSEDDSRLLVPLGQRLFVVDMASGRARECDIGEGFPFDPQLSPDGRHIAFVRDGDLWLLELETSTLRRLTEHEPGVEYGSAEFVAQEELDRKSGYLWSPDGRALVFQRTNASAVDTLYVSDPRHPERAPTPFKYPRAGTPNATVDLGIISLQPGAKPLWVRWDLERYPYLAKFDWARNAPLTALVLSRDQRDAQLFSVDAESGAMRELLRARDEAWLNLVPGSPTWLPDGSGFLWAHEEGAGYSLQLRAASGALERTLSPASFGLRAIYGTDGMDDSRRSAVVAASSDPREQHVYRIPLRTGAQNAEPLTNPSQGGVHTALAKHGVVVISSELRAGNFACSAVHADGRRSELPSLAEHPQLVPTTQLEQVNAAGRTLYTSITRPRVFDPKRRYPVLLRVYGGPHVSYVQDTRSAYWLDQFYADAGFIVLRADGRGTPNRGRDFERAVHKDLISVPLQDQADALQAMIARHPELDAERVGVFGWSFGGYFSSMAALLRPDIFKAAVAGAPVTDWSLYDTAYTERYMQTPQDNPSGYKHTSALTHAAKLQRPLLLIHGLTDDNVHFAHTLALIEALYGAGKAATVVALSSTHMVVDPKLNFAREQVQVEFFRQHLAK